VKKEDQNNNRQFGPRQMIYSPPEMRLGQALDTRAKRLGKAVSVVNYQRSLSPRRVKKHHLSLGHFLATPTTPPDY
jgi:hypothetical protein